MKNDREIMNSIRAAIDDCTRGIEEMPSLQYRIARKAKGEEPMAKKYPALWRWQSCCSLCWQALLLR